MTISNIYLCSSVAIVVCCISHYIDTRQSIQKQTPNQRYIELHRIASHRIASHRSHILTSDARTTAQPPHLSMIPSFFTLLSDDLQTVILSLLLDVRSLATLDVSVSSHVLRPSWMTLLKSLRCPALDKRDHGLSSLMWLSRRGIRVS